MLTEKEMNAIAEKYVSDLFQERASEMVILYEFTVKKSYGNVYVYNSKKYIETKDFKFALVGNAPFLVEKETGKIVVFGTAQRKNYYIQEYEAGRWLTTRKPD
ncbi:MAG: hypothetical protein JNM88_04175 [Chitinophagaceae bacterium]|nr:hypothetical protein [Chitinophagaceae bacterium]